MLKQWLSLGAAAGLLLGAGALGGCGQNNQASDRDVHPDTHAQVNTAKVEKGAERASRELSAGATALVEGVKKGVKEGTSQAQRDSHARQGQEDNTTTTTTTTTERSPNG